MQGDRSRGVPCIGNSKCKKALIASEWGWNRLRSPTCCQQCSRGRQARRRGDRAVSASQRIRCRPARQLDCRTMSGIRTCSTSSGATLTPPILDHLLQPAAKSDPPVLLGRGTDGSKPSTSSGESRASPTFLGGPKIERDVAGRSIRSAGRSLKMAIKPRRRGGTQGSYPAPSGPAPFSRSLAAN